MIDRSHLAQDLRAHAHEVPEHIGRIMRDAAAALDDRPQLRLVEDDAVRPPPFLPPPLKPAVKGRPC